MQSQTYSYNTDFTDGITKEFAKKEMRGTNKQGMKKKCVCVLGRKGLRAEGALRVYYTSISIINAEYIGVKLYV